MQYTERERDFLECMASGWSDASIVRELDISYQEIKHIKMILKRKFNVTRFDDLEHKVKVLFSQVYDIDQYVQP